MPGIKSVTITVEFADGTTEVATIENPREATVTHHRANNEHADFPPYRVQRSTAPTFDMDLTVKDATGIVWRAHPAPDLYPKPATVKVTPAHGCRAGRDGDCTWNGCPQLRDGEPKATGRHCPLDRDDDDV